MRTHKLAAADVACVLCFVTLACLLCHAVPTALLCVGPCWICLWEWRGTLLGCREKQNDLLDCLVWQSFFGKDVHLLIQGKE
jgi:hypothetical protein